MEFKTDCINGEPLMFNNQPTIYRITHVSSSGEDLRDILANCSVDYGWNGLKGSTWLNLLPADLRKRVEIDILETLAGFRERD